MDVKKLNLIAAGLALALSGGLQAATMDELFDPVTMDKPDGPPGQNKPNKPGRPDNPGNSGNSGNRGGMPGDRHGPPADMQLPNPGGNIDDGEDDERGHPGRGLALGHAGGAPGQCTTLDLEGPLGRSGRSHTAHVNFAALDEEGEFLEGEDVPWGRMTYFWVAPTFDFVFNGHNLTVETVDDEGDITNIEYVLAAEIEEDEGVSLWCLGSGVVNNGGNVHILNAIELDSHLPVDLDPFGDDDEGDEGEGEGEGDAEEEEGVGLVLLPAGAVDCDTGELTGEEVDGDILYSTEMILYVDSDLEDEEEDDGEGDDG